MKFFCLLLLLSGCICAQVNRDASNSFDKPTKIVRDYGPSPYYTANYHVRKKLTCYIYSNFMVKEYDDGQKGAAWLSILRFDPSGSRPKCTLSHLSGEKIIKDNWSGYFKGAKDSFAFFDADDGTDGGLPFFVYDARTGKMIFKDSARLVGGGSDRNSLTDFRIEINDDHQLVLRYLRVVSADCSLKAHGIACWNRVRAKYSLIETKRPVCRGYGQAERKTASAVGYPITVVLSENPHFTPVDGPISCWPVD